MECYLMFEFLSMYADDYNSIETAKESYELIKILNFRYLKSTRICGNLDLKLYKVLNPNIGLSILKNIGLSMETICKKTSSKLFISLVLEGGGARFKIF